MSIIKVLSYSFLLVIFFISNAIAQDSWSRIADMPTATSVPSVAIVNEKIYALGGHSDQMIFFSTLGEYDPATDNWTIKADMPTKRGYFSCSVVNGKIYAIGGYNPTTLSTVEELRSGN